MKTKKEKQKWILENCVDNDGDINLTELDFSGKEVYLSHMKAKTIHQRFHVAEEVSEGRHTIFKPTKTFTLQEAIDIIAETKGIDKDKIEIK